MAGDEAAMQRGRETRMKLMGEEMAGDMAAKVYDDPMMRKFGDYAIEAVFDGLWNRPGLDHKTRALICCISDTSTGRWPELAIHLQMARRLGWTEDELSEAILHLAGYVGLPLVREGMIIARETFEKMREDEG